LQPTGRRKARRGDHERQKARKKARFAAVVGDPYLERAHRSVPIDLWLKMEATLCDCEDVCTCGWDDLEEPGPRKRKWVSYRSGKFYD
jgi:hypothetical protein